MKMKLGISINKANQVLLYIDYCCIVDLCCTLNEINHIVAGQMNCSPNKDSPKKGDITKRSVRVKPVLHFHRKHQMELNTGEMTA